MVKQEPTGIHGLKTVLNVFLLEPYLIFRNYGTIAQKLIDEFILLYTHPYTDLLET